MDSYINANGDILGYNMFAYCGNNPIMYVDVMGSKHDLLIFLTKILIDVYDYDKDNTSEEKVLKSNYFSSYKGKLVLRLEVERSGSFGIIFIAKAEINDSYGRDTVRHEYGHTKQFEQMNVFQYALWIGLPSWLEWSDHSYYDRPWEVTADLYGEVQTRTHEESYIEEGEEYLNIAQSKMPIRDKLKDLSQYYG